ncbi:MAG: aminotransferase class I/II-fold pyridoxal phosphate-dependent enzyme, partial [Deltaproteobacteria bacterium]
AQSMDVCVVVDEAYGDFMEKSNSAINLINKFDNVFVVRSLSKGWLLSRWLKV